MLRRTLVILLSSFLVLAGRAMASREFAAALTGSVARDKFGLAEDTSRATVVLPELPDAPSAVIASEETIAAAEGPQYEVLQNAPQIQPQVALEISPEFQLARPESAAIEANLAQGLPPANVLPDAASAFHLFLRRSSTPSVFANAFFDAAMAQHKNDWPGYGRGAGGFGKRYGATIANRTASRFFGDFLMPTLFHQAPRYRRLGSGASVWQRMEYSVSRVLLTHSQSGRNTLNSSLLLSTLLSKSVQNLYYPRQQRGFDLTLRRTERSLMGELESNLEREFLPDIERFIWKHLPARIKRVEKRIPFFREWEPESFSS